MNKECMQRRYMEGSGVGEGERERKWKREEMRRRAIKRANEKNNIVSSVSKPKWTVRANYYYKTVYMER